MTTTNNTEPETTVEETTVIDSPEEEVTITTTRKKGTFFDKIAARQPETDDHWSFHPLAPVMGAFIGLIITLVIFYMWVNVWLHGIAPSLPGFISFMAFIGVLLMITGGIGLIIQAIRTKHGYPYDPAPVTTTTANDS